MLEFGLIHIVLILTYANALGIDLHQFCEWIHQSASYGNSSTNSYVLIRELIARNLRGRIDRGTIFADDKTLNIDH